MLRDKSSRKMTHIRDESGIRSNSGGVVSIGTIVNFSNNIIIWDMVVCSRKDKFIKSLSKQLCDSNPLKSGIVAIPQVIIDAINDVDCMNLNTYFEQVVIHDILNSKTLVAKNGIERHCPKWADKLLAERYVYNSSGRLFDIFTRMDFGDLA